MERLTNVTGTSELKVVVYNRGEYEDTTAAEMKVEDIRAVLTKLAAYEDSGLRPEDAGKLKELYTAKIPDYEGDGYDNDGNIIYDTWICPNCRREYEVDYDDYKFCPECGQKIEQKNDMPNLEKTLKKIEEASIQESAPIYHGNTKVDNYIRLSVVQEIIRKYFPKDIDVHSRREWYQIGYADGREDR